MIVSQYLNEEMKNVKQVEKKSGGLQFSNRNASCKVDLFILSDCTKLDGV